MSILIIIVSKSLTKSVSLEIACALESVLVGASLPGYLRVVFAPLADPSDSELAATGGLMTVDSCNKQ